MNKMDDWTRKHLRAWIENHSPVDPEDWDKTEKVMSAVVFSDPDYWLDLGWDRVYWESLSARWTSVRWDEIVK